MKEFRLRVPETALYIGMAESLGAEPVANSSLLMIDFNSLPEDVQEALVQVVNEAVEDFQIEYAERWVPK